MVRLRSSATRSGGSLAYEVARQAVDAGQQVEWLGILDSCGTIDGATAAGAADAAMAASPDTPTARA